MQDLLRVFSVVLLVFIMLILSSCEISIGGKNDSVVDGIRLKYDNAMTLSRTYDLPNLEIPGGILSADLKGRAGKNMVLEIKYHEYEPGDATVFIADGKIQTRSKSGKPVSLYKITGSIPENLGLTIKSGTGRIELADLNGRQNISIDSGTGNIELRRCSIEKLSVDTGTGSVTLSDNRIDQVSVETGTGNLILNNNLINKQDFDSGTGKIIKNESNLDSQDKRSI